jgi:uncharacterized iron-regulated membrane protein
MAKKITNSKMDRVWEQTWFKLIGSCFVVSSVVAGILIFFYDRREDDIKERFKDKLESQKEDCEKDNENRLLQLKLDVQTEYFIEPSPDSPTAKKMEKVFSRIDKTKSK